MAEGEPLAAPIGHPADGSTILCHRSSDRRNGGPAIRFGQKQSQVSTGLHADAAECHDGLSSGRDDDFLIDGILVQAIAIITQIMMGQFDALPVWVVEFDEPP